MCHRRQKSTMLRAWYGESKFSGSTMLSMSARPMAMSVYPEKSKYSWSVKASVAPHASANTTAGARSKMGATQGPKVSAIITFLNSPMAKMNSPLGDVVGGEDEGAPRRELRHQLLEPDDRSGDQVRKEADEKTVTKEVVVAGVVVDRHRRDR